ncbi:hypothetical protein SFUMM280S_00027 [Streptomyces fumanus]
MAPADPAGGAFGGVRVGAVLGVMGLQVLPGGPGAGPGGAGADLDAAVQLGVRVVPDDADQGEPLYGTAGDALFGGPWDGPGLATRSRARGRSGSDWVPPGVYGPAATGPRTAAVGGPAAGGAAAGGAAAGGPAAGGPAAGGAAAAGGTRGRARAAAQVMPIEEARYPRMPSILDMNV